MKDRLDEMLGALGKGTPVPVDWEAYGRELLLRLQRSQARSRRRGWGAATAGVLAGAAAVLIALPAFHVHTAPVFQPPNPVETQAMAERPIPHIAGNSRGMIRTQSADSKDSEESAIIVVCRKQSN